MGTEGMGSPSVDGLRREMVETGREMARRSFVESTAGNISCRIEANRALISPAGWRLGELKDDCLIEIGIEDRVCTGNPSSETPTHLGIYRTFPEIGAVIHAHPPYATAFAVAGVELQYDVLPEVVAQLGPVPIAPYGRPTTEALFESIRQYLGSSNAILLRNHGSITTGANLRAAFGYLEQLEFYASVLYRALRLGAVTSLPEEEFNWLQSVRENVLGKSTKKI